VDSAGAQGNDWSLGASITPDARFVAFHSLADELVAGDTNFDYDVFVYDRTSQTTTRPSVRSDGSEGGLSLASVNPSLSAYGTVVAFDSEADLVQDETGFRSRCSSTGHS
jgi:Tol biopolymer transport system component